MLEKFLRFRYSIRSKIVIMVSFLLIFVSVVIGLSSYEIAKTELEDQGKIILENTVNMILMLIDTKNDEVERGIISLDEAQEQVKTYILGKAEETGNSVEIVYNQAGDKHTIKEIKRSINSDINLGENGYPIIYSTEGLEIAHPSREGTNIWNLKEYGKADGKYFAQEQINAAKQEGGGFVSYKGKYPNSDELGQKISFQKLDPNWNWVVVAGTYESDFHQEAFHILLFSALFGLIALMIGIFITLFEVNRIVGPIQTMVDTADELANGDFRDKKRKIKNKDEIGKLAKSFMYLRENVHAILQSIYESADRLMAASEELTASAEQSSQASTQVVNAVNEVAVAADKQLDLAENAESVVGQISKSINLVLSNAKDVSDSAKKTADVANEGEVAIEKVVSQMEIIADRTNDTAIVINELEGKSTKIGEIVDVISAISEQTNLLSLNAAIEASKAGESGKGFSVVAEEVRKLAEQSQNAANQITIMIQEVQEKMDSAVTFMNDGKKEVEEGARVVSIAGKSFDEILSMIKNVTVKVKDIYLRVEQIDSQTGNVVMAVENINNESKKTSGEAQTISAATQEQSASSEEIAAASENLAQMAVELQQILKKFQV